MGNKVLGWLLLLGGVFFGIAAFPTFVLEPSYNDWGVPTGDYNFALIALWVILTLGLIICGIAFIRIKKRSKK